MFRTVRVWPPLLLGSLGWARKVPMLRFSSSAQSLQAWVVGNKAMTTPPPKRPEWAGQYLQLGAWTYDELRNLLCGLPPIQPLDEPPRTRQQATEYYVAAEAQRVVADRHVRDAVAAGLLKVCVEVHEDILSKLGTVLPPSELDAVRRAVVHERVCNKAYFVSPHDAIRWACRRPDLFPNFPFSDADLPGGGEVLDRRASEALKQRRRRLLATALEARGMTDDGLRERLGVKADTVRAIVAGDKGRYSEVTERRLLEIIDLTRDEWNREP